MDYRLPAPAELMPSARRWLGRMFSDEARNAQYSAVELTGWLHGSPRHVANRLSGLSNAAIVTFAAIIIVALFFAHLRAAISSEQFTPFSLVEETAYTLISAQNFL